MIVTLPQLDQVEMDAAQSQPPLEHFTFVSVLTFHARSQQSNWEQQPLSSRL